jgi:hypothetical protein
MLGRRHRAEVEAQAPDLPVMTTHPPRFITTRQGLADRDTGLEWAPAPATLPVVWADAAAAVAERAQRLPTAHELLALLTGLPAACGMPQPGDVFWSSSGSPFAPGIRVRAVACDGPARFVVVLLDRTERARWWGVRVAGAPGADGQADFPGPERA